MGDVYFFLNPLTAGAVHIRFFTFFSAYYISAFNPVRDKNQQDLKFVDFRFVKSE